MEYILFSDELNKGIMTSIEKVDFVNFVRFIMHMLQLEEIKLISVRVIGSWAYS